MPYQLVNVSVCKMHRKVLLHADFQFNSILRRFRRLHSNHSNSVERYSLQDTAYKWWSPSNTEPSNLIHVAGKTAMFPDDRQSYKLSVYENELHELSIVGLGLRPAQRCGVRRAHQMVNTALKTNTFGNVWDLKNGWRCRRG